MFGRCEIEILSFILHGDKIIYPATSHQNSMSNEVDRASVFVAPSYHDIVPGLSQRVWVVNSPHCARSSQFAFEIYI